MGIGICIGMGHRYRLYLYLYLYLHLHIFLVIVSLSVGAEVSASFILTYSTHGQEVTECTASSQYFGVSKNQGP